MRIDVSADECPNCQQPCGTPTLLTSMVRYYTCSGCARSWQIVRDFAVIDEQSLERESLDLAPGDAGTSVQRGVPVCQ